MVDIAGLRMISPICCGIKGEKRVGCAVSICSGTGANRGHFTIADDYDIFSLLLLRLCAKKQHHSSELLSKFSQLFKKR